MLNNGKITLECIDKEPCTSSMIITHLISYEKGVIASFEHCSESSLIYGDLINNLKQLLTDLFRTTSEVQKLFFNIIQKVTFDLTLKEDQDLVLTGKKKLLLYSINLIFKSAFYNNYILLFLYKLQF